MSGMGLGSFISGMGAGALQGQQLAREQKRQDMRDAAFNEDQAYQREQRDKAKTLERGLASAYRPAEVVEGSGGALRLADMDNRDVGLPENFKPAPQVVNGQTVPDAPPPMNGGLGSAMYRGADGKEYTARDEAQKSVDAYNSPRLADMRAADVYRAAGKPNDALSLETGVRQGKLQDQQLADSKWRLDIGKAMAGGHNALAQLVTGSEMGPMAGRKIQAVPSADGKQVVYNEVGADNTLTPLPQFTFSNDSNGVTRAAYMLDSSITPEHRYTSYMTEQKNAADAARRAADTARLQANDDRSFQLKKDTLAAVTGARAGAAAAKQAGAIPAASTKLRTEFEALPDVKNYKQALPSFKGIEDAIKRNNPMSDINIVYGIAKLYDPTSVVREGEYATVAKAPNMPEQVKGWIQYVEGGGRLTPTVKQQILGEAKSRMGSYEGEYMKQAERYRDIASRSGGDPSLVIDPNLKSVIRQVAQPGVTSVKGGDGKTYVFKGGDPNKQESWGLAK